MCDLCNEGFTKTERKREREIKGKKTKKRRRNSSKEEERKSGRREAEACEAWRGT